MVLPVLVVIIKNLKLSRDHRIFCTATKSKETRNTEDSENEIIHKSLIPTCGLLL